MTTEITTTTDQRQNGNKKPGYLVKVRHGFGKKATYERIGVAWLNDDDSVYVKLYGTQIVDQGFTLYRVEDNKAGGSSAPVEDDKASASSTPVEDDDMAGA